jgi:hypothetical protein
MTPAEISSKCPVNCELADEYEDWVFDCAVNPPVKRRKHKIKVQAKNGGADCTNPIETQQLSEADLELCGKGGGMEYIIIAFVLAVFAICMYVFAIKKSSTQV